MKKIVFTCTYAGLLLLLSFCSSIPAVPGTTARFIEKKKGPVDIPEGQSYRFGYLEVPENRQNPNSNRIQLPVYIFKSRNPNPQPDPIIYTVGGPGYSTMPSARYMEYYQYLDDRDFILIEQRGNYYAKPHLECPEWAKAVYLARLPTTTATEADSLRQQAAQACRVRLRQQGIDLNGYHTIESAADIADLTKVLGIDEYNLLTISYSTKIAQVLMRDHPKGIRSVVMDSPLPLEVSYDEESVQNLLETLDNVLSECEKSTSCNQAFPNLKERFYKYLEAITVDPLEVSVKNAEVGKQAIFRIQGQDLALLFSTLSSDDIPTVPLAIQNLMNGDQTVLQEFLSSRLEGPGDGAGIGMRLSVWCAEEYPFASQQKIKQETNRYSMISGLSPEVYSASVCNAWKVNVQPASENMAIKSDIPVLLMSGELDSDTPPKWAKQMHQNLSNSYHLVFRAWRHTVTTYWSKPCGMESANAFFNDPYSKPNLDCFEKLPAPSFLLK